MNNKELVKQLGDKIGYGNMMALATELWKEHMIEKGYPTSGVFIPALFMDIKENRKNAYKNYGVDDIK